MTDSAKIISIDPIYKYKQNKNEAMTCMFPPKSYVYLRVFLFKTKKNNLEIMKDKILHLKKKITFKTNNC